MDSPREILDNLRRLVRVLRVGARSAEQQLGLSSAQLFILHQLGARPADGMTDLAARTLTDPSSVSVVVSRLVRAGLVTRARSPRDGRRAVIALTTAGRRRLARAPEPAQARLFAALRRLSPTRRRQLAGGLAALVREMGAGNAPARLFFEGDRRAS